MCRECHPDWSPEMYDLHVQCVHHGQCEEFHQRMAKDNAVLNSGGSNHGYMQEWHKTQRLALEEKFRALDTMRLMRLGTVSTFD